MGLVVGAGLYIFPAYAVTCPTSDVQIEARQQALAAQRSLLAVTGADMETGVPDTARVGLLRLKEGLVRAVDAEVVCHRGSDAELQRKLSRALQANQPEKPVSPAKSGSEDRPVAGQYGGDLKIVVTPEGSARSAGRRCWV